VRQIASEFVKVPAAKLEENALSIKVLKHRARAQRDYT
jgi:hypothetical protein